MHGLYLLWWVDERGLSPASAAAILMAGDVAVFALEVPTGWVADRYGHRASLIAGSFVQVLGMLACWLGRGVPELVLASILVGTGDALRSGADQALLYRSCAALGREGEFLRIEARTRAAGLVSLVVLLLTGGFIVERWGFAAGWATETALCVVGAVIAWMMAEPPADIRPSDVEDHEQGTGTGPADETARGWLRTIGLILPSAIIGAVASAASFLTQVTGTTDPTAITGIVAAITLSEAAGAGLASRWRAVGVREQWLLLAGGAALVLATASLPLAAMLLAVSLSFLAGLAEPLRAALLQRAAEDRARARTASLASACDMACSAVVLSLTGVWRASRRGRR